MTVLEKIAALRAAMEAEGADGVYVPSSDPHMTEYLPARWRCRAWLSGFTGSAGTLCVTREAAALWTDGRYFIQAERQLEGSGITLMRMAQPGVPTAEEWLADRMPAGGTLALDGACTSVSVVESLEKALAEKELSCVTTILFPHFGRRAAAHTCDRSMAAGAVARGTFRRGKAAYPAGEACPAERKRHAGVPVGQCGMAIEPACGRCGVQPVCARLLPGGAEGGASVH